jgi:hypothetical protein
LSGSASLACGDRGPIESRQKRGGIDPGEDLSSLVIVASRSGVGPAEYGPVEGAQGEIER